MSDAAQQNALMLASILGVDEAEAGERLERRVLVTAETGWKTDWAFEICEILGRTLEVSVAASGHAPDLELIVGQVPARTNAAHLFADLGAERAIVGRELAAPLNGRPHGLYGQAAACATAAAAIYLAVGRSGLPVVNLPLRLNFSDLGVPAGALDRPIELRRAVLAGAGAVAHGFLRAARHLDLTGALDVIDPKKVKAGVLNRCLYLEDHDINADKAIALAERAQPDFASLSLRPHVIDFKAWVKAMSGPPETVIVTVDSRRVRRSIQLEVPHRVLDASTTGVEAVIVHSNLLPTEHACLACIYRHVPEEHARERHIAAGLGVDLADVRSGIISAEVAQRISERNPGLDAAAITNTAFDSLFRELCSEQALTTPEGRQVLAPFAFVSAWAGVLLAVELVRSFAGTTTTNYWAVNPWNIPAARTRRLRPRHPDCQFCSRPEFEPVIQGLWGARHTS